MAGAIQERDLVAEAIEGQTPADKKTTHALFMELRYFLRTYLPHDRRSRLPRLPKGLTEEEREERQSYRKHQQFIAEINRQAKVWELDYLLMATILRDGREVPALIRAKRRSGYLIRKPSRLTISFPDSTVEDVLVLIERGAWVDPGQRLFTQEYAGAARRFIDDLKQPTTRIEPVIPSS
jgi:hypothetical protein